MSAIVVALARVFGQLGVPKDTLYWQARGIMDKADLDGDGVINMNDPKQRAKLEPFFRTGFDYMDSLGWNNGVISLRELRNGFKKYDVSGNPQTGGANQALEGPELVKLVQDILARTPSP